MVLDDKSLGLKFQDDGDLERLILHGKINPSQIQEYQSLPNIPKIFKDLVHVGTMLGLAKTYAGHHNCTTTILRVTMNYKDLISDSFITSTAFVSTCLQACKNVQLAYRLCKKQKYDLMGKQLMACATAAGKMSNDVEPLIQKARQLTSDTYDALEKTQHDQNATAEDKRKMREFIQQTKDEEAKAKTKVAENEKIKDSYQNQLNEYQKKVEALEKDVIKSAEEMQEMMAKHADEFMASENAEKYAKELADAEEGDRNEWLQEKKEIEDKRQKRLDAEIQLQREKEAKLQEEKQKIKEERDKIIAINEARKKQFEEAVKEAKRNNAAREDKAEADYQTELKAWQTQQSANRKQDATAKSNIAAATRKIADLNRKKTQLEADLKAAQSGVKASRKEWADNKNEADRAKANAGEFLFIKWGHAEAATAEGQMETSAQVQAEWEQDVKTLEQQLSAVEKQIGEQEASKGKAESEQVAENSQKPQKKKINYFEDAGKLELMELPQYEQQPEGSVDMGANIKSLMSTLGGLFEKDEFAIPPEPSPGRRALRLQKERDAKIQQFNNMLEAKKKSHEAAIKAKETVLAESRGEMSKEKEEFTKLEHSLAEDKSKLAKTLQTLEHSIDNEDNLQKALEGLGLAMSTLGKIAVTFDNVKKFWALTKQHCERIALECDKDEMEAFVALEDEDELMIKIETLLKNWAVLGRQNVAARNAIHEACDNVDEFFNNIPVEGDRKDFIEAKVKMLQASMMDDLEKEERCVKELMEDDIDEQ